MTLQPIKIDHGRIVEFDDGTRIDVLELARQWAGHFERLTADRDIRGSGYDAMGNEVPPPCPRCGEPCHPVPTPIELGDTSWVWGHDCEPPLP